jgi:hypothetical protein
VNVYLLRDDRQVAQVRVNNLGIFEVENLTPGSYGLVAAGRGGFGAVGFNLVRANPAIQGVDVMDRRDLFQFAVRRRALPLLLAQNPAGAGNIAPFPFSMSLVDDPRNIRAAFALNAPQPLPMAQGAPAMANAPFMPPAGPMGGSGGGNNGGFSNAGGLLAAAALATAIALPLALDDGNGTELISPFSPMPPPDTTPTMPTANLNLTEMPGGTSIPN